jgi:hypothetical protein
MEGKELISTIKKQSVFVRLMVRDFDFMVVYGTKDMIFLTRLACSPWL